MIAHTGLCVCTQVDKHGLVMELGVPYRDLRMLDPLVCVCVRVCVRACPCVSACVCKRVRAVQIHQ